MLSKIMVRGVVKKGTHPSNMGTRRLNLAVVRLKTEPCTDTHSSSSVFFAGVCGSISGTNLRTSSLIKSVNTL